MLDLISKRSTRTFPSSWTRSRLLITVWQELRIVMATNPRQSLILSQTMEELSTQKKWLSLKRVAPAISMAKTSLMLISVPGSGRMLHHHRCRSICSMDLVLSCLTITTIFQTSVKLWSVVTPTLSREKLSIKLQQWWSTSRLLSVNLARNMFLTSTVDQLCKIKTWTLVKVSILPAPWDKTVSHNQHADIVQTYTSFPTSTTSTKVTLSRQVLAILETLHSSMCHQAPPTISNPATRTQTLCSVSLKLCISNMERHRRTRPREAGREKRQSLAYTLLYWEISSCKIGDLLIECRGEVHRFHLDLLECKVEEITHKWIRSDEELFHLNLTLTTTFLFQ